MDKQETAFQAWLNAVLVPAPADSEGGSGGLASRRLVARLRGLLWQLYSQDQELIRCVWVVDGGMCYMREVCAAMLAGRSSNTCAVG